MKKTFIILLLTILSLGCPNLFGQPIIVNSLDDNNDGNCNTSHCSLREAINLANTFNNPKITFEINPTTPLPWIIRPISNLPKIQSDDPLFNLTIIDEFSTGITISGSLLPGKILELDHGLEIDTEGKVDIKRISFRDFSKGLIVSKVDTLILGGGKSPLIGEDGNNFFYNKGDLFFNGTFAFCLILGNCFGSNRSLNEGIGFGETGISCRNGLISDGTLIIGNSDIPALKCNWFSGHTLSGIDLNGFSNVTINGNFFDTDRSSQPLLPAAQSNIQLTSCENISISENYLGAADHQVKLVDSRNIEVEFNYFGTINHFLSYPMKNGLIINQCEDISIGNADPARGNVFNGHNVRSILVENSSLGIKIFNNVLGVFNGIDVLPAIKEGIVFVNSGSSEISGNSFLGVQENCVRISGCDQISIFKNDFSVYDIFPPGSTGIFVDESREINIGDPIAPGNNIFTRLNKGIDIYGSGSRQIFNYQNSFYCNTGKGLSLHSSANSNIASPFPYKRSGNVIYGKAHPMAQIQIYDHGQQCPDTPCQGKTFLGETNADGNGIWSYDFSGKMNGLKTFTATRPNLGSSEFSECYEVAGFTELTLSTTGDICDSLKISANFANLPSGVQFEWSGPDGLSTTSSSIFASRTGCYYVEISNPDWNYILMDSICVNLKTATVNTISTSVCSGNSFEIEGHIYDESNPEGEFVSQFKNYEGCDSIIRIKLLIEPLIEIDLNPDLCPQEILMVGDSLFNFLHPEGIVLLKSNSPDECDSLFHVKINYLESSVRFIDTTVCKGNQIEINGTLITEEEPEKSIILNIPGQSGCDSLIYVNANFVAPTISSLDIEASCKNGSNGRISFSIDSSHYSPFDIYLNGTFLKSTADINSDINNLNHGTYQIIIKDDKECESNSANIEIEQFPLNIVNFEDQIEINPGTSYQIILDSGLEVQSINWTPELFLSCNNCLNPIVTPTADQNYRFDLTDENGCLTSGILHVIILEETKSEIFAPNIFSPNGDGNNDFFEVSFKNCTIKEMTIMNRWGANVYSSTVNFSWDGSFRNLAAETGTYTYLVKYMNNLSNKEKVIKGTVNIVR